MSEQETFTDFMVRCMTDEDEVQQAIVIVRRSDGTMTYHPFRQEMMDTVGMLRYAALSVEHETVRIWQEEEE